MVRAVVPAVQDLLATLLLREDRRLEELQGREDDAERPGGDPFTHPLSDSPETLRGEANGWVHPHRLSSFLQPPGGKDCERWSWRYLHPLHLVASRTNPLQDLHRAGSRPADVPPAFGPRGRRKVETARSGCAPLGSPFFGRDHRSGCEWIVGPGLPMQSSPWRGVLRSFKVQGR